MKNVRWSRSKILAVSPAIGNKSSQSLKLVGWAIASVKNGKAPQEIWIRLSPLSGGSPHFYRALQTPRPDVAVYFNQPQFRNVGFSANIDLNGLQGIQKVDILAISEGAALDFATGRLIEAKH
jgi:hypothetical protein